MGGTEKSNGREEVSDSAGDHRNRKARADGWLGEG